MIRTLRAFPNGEIQLIDYPLARQTTLTPLEFIDRISEDKLLALETATTQEAARLRAALRRVTLMPEVDLDHPATIALLNAMQAARLLTAAEVAAIRNG